MPRLLPLYGGPDAGPRPVTREAVHAALARGVDPAEVASYVGRGLDQMADDVARALLGAPRPACSRGCSDCCHQRVELSAPEVLLLARFIRSLAERDRARVESRIRETASLLEGLSSREHFGRQLPCALLDVSGGCVAYDARPLACRRAHSIDRSACAAARTAPASAVRIPDSPALTAHLSAIVLGYLEGASHAGSPPHHYELHAALGIALRHGAPRTADALAEALGPARTRRAEEVAELLGARES